MTKRKTTSTRLPAKPTDDELTALAGALSARFAGDQTAAEDRVRGVVLRMIAEGPGTGVWDSEPRTDDDYRMAMGYMFGLLCNARHAPQVRALLAAERQRLEGHR